MYSLLNTTELRVLKELRFVFSIIYQIYHTSNLIDSGSLCLIRSKVDKLHKSWT